MINISIGYYHTRYTSQLLTSSKADFTEQVDAVSVTRGSYFELPPSSVKFDGRM